MGSQEKLGIIVVSQVGGISVGILGGKIVIIKPEDPSWGSIISKANAAAAVAKVEGAKSKTAINFANEAIEEFASKATRLSK
jgi:hypothetical protein